MPGPDKRCYRVTFAKAEEGLPGFDPQWDVRRGARELYDCYREQELDGERFDGPSYKRLDHIRRLLEAGRLAADLRWA